MAIHNRSASGMANLPTTQAVDLPYDPSSVSVARHWITDILSGVVSDDIIYNVTVCVSELVTNSLEHTAPTDERKDITCRIHVKLLTSMLLIHVECIDPGSQGSAPAGRQAAATDEHGRGLQIVKEFGDEWGYDDKICGQRTTWFIVVTEPFNERRYRHQPLVNTLTNSPPARFR